MSTVVAIQPGQFAKEKKERGRKVNHFNEEMDDNINV